MKMTEAPERIWVEPGMPGWLDEPNDFYTNEYIRADLAKPTVKPLEWVRTQEDTGWSADAMRSVYYVLDDGYWYLWVASARVRRAQEFNAEAAKEAAQADYEQRILSALGVSDE